ncbi:phosphate ABC transporter substrate-binding protein [Waterburya agarophytonicola K14]|uniref:Phosphate ABC transporter substrate-binding protein n=1 Tax=Waterburya agarophytonicola KI4 TaxID=2874699 RepID=A0A964BV19_9CYAN|nr:phosphate ABC transporter substrate-binding protein [Waterburya agarophytonicola]MCC0178973.1 phosphate ABC transporter substrate-binding protein [Waterburya agarophytonicola KI4]
MSQKNEILPLILILICTGAIVGGGYWWFELKSDSDTISTTDNTDRDRPNDSENNFSNIPNSPIANSNKNSPVTFSLPTNVTPGTNIRIDGSTSMVQINQAIEQGFEKQFIDTEIATNGQGTEVGLKLLSEGKIDIAAISRPLTDSDRDRGLNAVPIAKDAIAIVVGANNPFRRGLKQEQIADIFQGNITNWSNVGGQTSNIRVINRPSISGTRQVFQEEVLNGANFGNSANFTTFDRDATTPILRALGKDGISYATYAQVANQQTVRTVSVNGLTPEADNYPYYRVLYYAYQEPASPEVKAFLGYVLSPQGQKAIASGN